MLGILACEHIHRSQIRRLVLSVVCDRSQEDELKNRMVHLLKMLLKVATRTFNRETSFGDHVETGGLSNKNFWACKYKFSTASAKVNFFIHIQSKTMKNMK